MAKEPGAPMQLALLLNDITLDKFKASEEVPIKLSDSDKTLYSNEWCTYRECNAKLVTH